MDFIVPQEKTQSDHKKELIETIYKMIDAENTIENKLELLDEIQWHIQDIKQEITDGGKDDN